jgi:hypothetical protein
MRQNVAADLAQEKSSRGANDAAANDPYSLFHGSLLLLRMKFFGYIA